MPKFNEEKEFIFADAKASELTEKKEEGKSLLNEELDAQGKINLIKKNQDPLLKKVTSKKHRAFTVETNE